MSQSETVSIVLPCYNCEKTLGDTLESVFKQGYKDFKIYAIDDGSTDQTHQILLAYAQKNDQQMNVYRQPNSGQAIAKNHALQLVEGQYIAFIDSDDLWASGKLQAQVDVLDNHPEVGLCYTNGEYIDERGNVKGKIGIENALQGKCLEKILLKNAIVASSVMIRRSLLDDVGHFDEGLRACENWELWTRISEKSDLFVIDKPLVCYRQHANNLSQNLISMRKNRLAVIQKNAAHYHGRLDSIQEITEKALFQAYAFFGENLLWKGQPKAARKDIMQALKMRPRTLKLYILFLKTFLGVKGLRWIRTIRGRHFEHSIP